MGVIYSIINTVNGKKLQHHTQEKDHDTERKNSRTTGHRA